MFKKLIEVWYVQIEKELLSTAKDGVVADLEALQFLQELRPHVSMGFFILFLFARSNSKLKGNSLQGESPRIESLFQLHDCYFKGLEEESSPSRCAGCSSMIAR